MMLRVVLLLSILPSWWSFVILPQSPLYKKHTSILFATEPLSSSNLYGGDFAGLSASFSPQDGTLIKVPEHLVPKALLEWGKAPSCFEVLVSEEFSDNNLKRQTVQILPAVGCGVDNLETFKKEEVLEIQSLQITDDDSMISFDVPLGDGNTLAESTFVSGEHRLRVGIDVDHDTESGFSLQKPITMVLERQISADSSGGTIADGGGLTGSKVSEMMGDLIKTPLFCDQTPLEWQPPGVKVLNLPGNVTIACSLEGGQDPWMLDIVYVNINEKGEAEKQVVRRSYHAPEYNPDTE